MNNNLKFCIHSFTESAPFNPIYGHPKLHFSQQKINVSFSLAMDKHLTI